MRNDVSGGYLWSLVAVSNGLHRRYPIPIPAPTPVPTDAALLTFSITYMHYTYYMCYTPYT